MGRTASVQDATILPFPVGGRPGARPWSVSRVETTPTPSVVVDCDAWYHQAAMEDEKPRGNA